MFKKGKLHEKTRLSIRVNVNQIFFLFPIEPVSNSSGLRFGARATLNTSSPRIELRRASGMGIDNIFIDTNAIIHSAYQLDSLSVPSFILVEFLCGEKKKTKNESLHRISA